MSDENALNHCVNKCSRDVQSKYPGYHMNWWNPEKATRMLNAAGFSNVYQSAYGQSASPILRDVTLFDVQDPKLSLYVEAVKG
jgi:2-methylisocitrate lyase-like PEP mutase family enzyme